MSDVVAIEREDSALLPGAFRLAITAPDDERPVVQTINGQFALIGRDEHCSCRIEDPLVSRRHAYLQAVFGRIFCVDLGSRGGISWADGPRKSGWLDPEQSIRIGSYQIRLLDTLGLGGGAERLAENFDPLGQYTGQFGPLPKIEIEVLNGPGASSHYAIRRLITLVGSSSRCKFRIEDKSISPTHCSLLLMRDGLWVIDLGSKGGIGFSRKPARCAKLEDGQKFRVGRVLMRVRYSGQTIPSIDIAKQSAPNSVSFEELADDSPIPKPIAPREDSPAARLGGGQPGQTEPIVGAGWLASERSALDVGRSEVEKMRFDLARSQQELAMWHDNLSRQQEFVTSQQQLLDARQQQVESRESKLGDAQQRLAVEWDRIHADRTALTAFSDKLAEQEETLAAGSQALAADADALERQRQELSAQTAHLAKMHRRFKVEWKKLQDAKQKIRDARNKLTAERSDMAQLNDELKRRKFEIETQDRTPPHEFDVISTDEPTSPAESADPLESTLHHKVFRTEQAGPTLVVTPLGDASEFYYGDVHTESNRVRRLLEGDVFRNLVVDLGSADLFGSVTINVIVALSRIASNRGGRAVLCNASEKTLAALQTMKLLELWPHFANREAAISAVGQN